jgi:hypothetical protein
VTTFTTAESPFKADSTASNKCGVTLMNNQIGAVVATVMKAKPGVTVTPLPSMIRVDAINRMDFVYDEISERSARNRGSSTPRSSRSRCRRTTGGWFTRTIGRSCSPIPRTPPSISVSICARPTAEETSVYEKDGERYFVVDGHTHFWDASPANWIPGQEQ